MASVDTNVVLRWILDDLPEQTARVEALFESTDRLVVDDATMIETVYVLERVVGLDREVIAEAIGSIIAEARLELDREHWSTVVALYTAHSKLSVTDIHLAVRAQKRGQPLLTFDKKLASQLSSVECL